MWLAGTPIETIATIYGHESTEMPLRYIGVNLNGQAKADEAALASQMGRDKETVEAIALRAGLSPEETNAKLLNMVGKGLHRAGDIYPWPLCLSPEDERFILAVSSVRERTPTCRQ